MLIPRRSIACPDSRNMKPTFRRICITMAVAIAAPPPNAMPSTQRLPNSHRFPQAMSNARNLFCSFLR
eukprot:COSAG02_NODE_59_length_43585_cov_39.087752_27_plen_68_part_00